jgi:hypothetical protein
MIVVPDISKLELLNKVLKDENVILKLYKNNYTPDKNALLSSFTEANFDGYSGIELDKIDISLTHWTEPVIQYFPCSENGTSGYSGVSGYNESVSTYSTQSWTCGSNGNIVYGYYIVGATSDKLLWVDTFATARTLGETDVLSIVPRLQLATINPC